MQTTSGRLAESIVPRYTSYPTAPNFSASVGNSTYAAWLSQLPAGEPLSLYLHVPFCAELCLYCGCNTKAVRRDAPVESYVQNLLAEIDLVGKASGRRKVSHLHWGGGTPSLLGGIRLSEIATRLGATFDLSEVREHAIELDPRSLNASLVHTLRSIGITRASLGVQDFSPHVQRAIGRIQPYDVVTNAVESLREAGIVDLNFDLMYGLPKQSIEDVRRSVVLAAGLKPKRIALFGYAHVPWFKPHQRLIDKADLPVSAERLAQMDAARDALISLGYQAVGFDHFAWPDDALARAARSGRLRRNFQGYTDDDASILIGLGASAIGRLPYGFVQNASDVAGYARAIAAGRFATKKGITLSPDDRLRAEVIERLMCDFEADLPLIAARYRSEEKFGPEIEALNPYVEQGYVTVEKGRVAVSESGRSYVRVLASTFDLYLQHGRKRHSIAV